MITVRSIRKKRQGKNGFACLRDCSVPVQLPRRPDHKEPETDLPGKFSASSAKPAENTEFDPWWEAFRDKQLNELVHNGMSDNLSVQEALERVVEAQASVIVAGAGAWPQVTATKTANIDGRSGSYLRRRSGVNSTTTKTVAKDANSSWLGQRQLKSADALSCF